MILRLGPMPSNQFAISYELVEYDAFPPMGALLVDRAPRARNNDRDAVAAFLAFGAWAGTSITLPNRVSPATAEAVRRDSKLFGLSVEPIEYYPKKLPIGAARVMVSTDLAADLATPHLAVLRSDRWNGTLGTSRSLAVGSNAIFIEPKQPLRQILAVAVLFAEDLDADCLVVSESHASADERRRLRDLLSAVRLGIDFE